VTKDIRPASIRAVVRETGIRPQDLATKGVAQMVKNAGMQTGKRKHGPRG
jgi:hypothetical protein